MRGLLKQSLRKHIIFLFSFVMLLACEKKEIPAAQGYTDAGLLGEHTGQNSFAWDGIYQGLLPCSDCQNIEVTLELKKENQFVLFKKYIAAAKNTNKKKEQEEGTFHWEDNGSKIVLDSTTNKYMFLVGDQTLFFLDNQGQMPQASEAYDYIFYKINADGQEEKNQQ